MNYNKFNVYMLKNIFNNITSDAMIDGIDPMPNPYDPKYNYFNKDANHSYDRRILNIYFFLKKEN